MDSNKDLKNKIKKFVLGALASVIVVTTMLVGFNFANSSGILKNAMQVIENYNIAEREDDNESIDSVKFLSESESVKNSSELESTEDFSEIENEANSIYMQSVQSAIQVQSTQNLELMQQNSSTSTVINGSTVTGESILKILQETNLQEGYYTFEVNEESYPIHLITYGTDQNWTEDQVFGDAGDVATSTTQAQNMVIVKVNGNVTVAEGVKVTAYSDENYGGPKGFLLYVTGTLTNNGEITMTAKGAKAQGQNVYLWKNIDETYEYVPAEGAKGGAAKSGSNGSNAGISGTGRQTAGGGSGGTYYGSAKSGAGAAGTSYSGGTGGGGAAYNTTAVAGQGAGGIGGTGRTGSATKYYTVGGGAGNPGGAGAAGGTKGSNGTGGLLTIYADNYINNGSLTSNGVSGGNAVAGGGSSGGGSINVFANVISKKGTTNVTGGLAVGTTKGGVGGTGTVTFNELNPNLIYTKKEIILNVNESYSIDVNKIQLVGKNSITVRKVTLGELQYSSLDTSIATVSNDGKITGIKNGRTKIKITDVTNNLNTYIYIDVTNNVKASVQEGKNFTIGLKQDGTVWSYGLNTSGQLGIGNNENKQKPIQIETLKDIKQISTGYAHSLALTKNGEVYSFGDGTKGQLGNGENTNSNIPIKIEGLSNIEKIDGYKNTSIALTNDGKVYIWGEGYNLLPTQIDFSHNVADISGSLILGEDGFIYNISDLTKPLENIYKISKISCGEAHNLALADNGTVYSWGKNTYGEVGTEATGTISVTEIAYNMQEISAGNCTSLLLSEEEKLYVIGNNANGQIGLDTTAKVTAVTQINLSEDVGIQDISAGEGTHSSIIDENGYVWDTGINTYGELGLDDTTARKVFTKMVNNDIRLNIRNEYIKIGDKLELTVVGPSEFNVFIKETQNQSEWTWSSSNEDVATIDNNGVVTGKGIGHTTITGYNSKTGLKAKAIINVYRNVEGAITVPQICVGEGYTVILKEDGTVWTSGKNNYGQLGDGTTINKKIPAQVKIDENTYLTNIKKISAGNNFILALTVDGDVYGWGVNKATYGSGWLGQGDNVTRLYATKMKGVGGKGYIENIIDISAGDRMTYVLNKDGDIYGAGYDNYCQIADTATKTRAYLTKVTKISDAIQIKGGYSNLVAMLTNSEVWIKGNNGFGQFGNGTTAMQGGLYKIGNDINEFTLGGNKTCILKEDGTLWATGYNGFGQLGVGDTANKIIYTQVKDSNGEVVKAKALSGIACNLQYIGEDGKVYLAGNNEYGQLSNGTKTNDNPLPIKMNNNDGTDVVDALLLEEQMSNENGTFNSGIIRQDGTVWLSGDNTYGQIGNATNESTDYLTKMGDGFLNYPEKNIILNVNQTKDLDLKLFNIEDDMNVFIDASSKLGNLKYEVEDTSIANIDESGTITGISQGITKIKVTDDTLGLSTYIWVKVVEDKNIQISLGYRFTVALKQDGTLWS